MAGWGWAAQGHPSHGIYFSGFPCSIAHTLGQGGSLLHSHKLYAMLVLEHRPCALLLCRITAMRAPVKLRLEAHASWVAATEVLMSKKLQVSNKRIMTEAIKIFNRRSPSHGLAPGGLARFIKRWQERVAETGSAADLHRRGRPSKLTEEMARRAVEILAEGAIDEDGDPTPYFDIYEARDASVELRNILAEAKHQTLDPVAPPGQI